MSKPLNAYCKLKADRPRSRSSRCVCRV